MFKLKQRIITSANVGKWVTIFETEDAVSCADYLKSLVEFTNNRKTVEKQYEYIMVFELR